MAELRTNYQNDIIDPSMDGRRRYEMVHNDDGTVSFIDRTLYTQVGDTIDANSVNEITGGVNTVSENLAKLVDDVTLDEDNLVDLTPYNSESNEYTFPCDGYIRFLSSGNSTVKLNNVAIVGTSNNVFAGLFVKKGLRTYWDGSPINAFIFVPLKAK